MEKNPVNSATTAQLVKGHLQTNVFLLDYLSRDLINIASLAREILPDIQKQNPKATLESVSIAVKRNFGAWKPQITRQLQRILSNVQIAMRTDLVLFCLPKTAKLPDIKEFQSDDVFFINQGYNEVTVIIDKRNSNLVRGPVLLQQKNLALISLKDTLINEKQNFRVTPGFVSAFLGNISMAGINISDIVSTYSQVTFVVEQKYLLNVYQICQDVVNLKHL
ncbi:hypothetical protein HYU40_05155 [Candidatus Woesearchaeota archaeon]|nr:hypothetical protein [Candidatus Woesearchaeota archaeon]